MMMTMTTLASMLEQMKCRHKMRITKVANRRGGTPRRVRGSSNAFGRAVVGGQVRKSGRTRDKVDHTTGRSLKREAQVGTVLLLECPE
jgi:hypothetical protein